MKKLIAISLLCFAFGAQVLACGCGAARPTVPNNNKQTPSAPAKAPSAPVGKTR